MPAALTYEEVNMTLEQDVILQCFKDSRIPKQQVVKEYTCKWTLDESDVEYMKVEVDEETIRGFMSANQIIAKSSELLQPNHGYTILTEADHKKLVGPTDDWSLFNEKFPGTRGLMSFSRVGFGLNNTQALIGTAFKYGFDAGGTSLNFYDYDGEKWIQGNTVWGETC